MNTTQSAITEHRAEFLRNVLNVFGRHGLASAEKMTDAELADVANALRAIARADHAKARVSA
jgi:hypothetical protein